MAIPIRRRDPAGPKPAVPAAKAAAPVPAAKAAVPAARPVSATARPLAATAAMAVAKPAVPTKPSVAAKPAPAAAPAKPIAATPKATSGKTKKPKKGKEEGPVTAEVRHSLMLDAMCTTREAISGAKGALVTADDMSYRIVLPTPSIAHNWLFGMSGFPLGIVYMLVSPPGVGKSTLLAEHFRWFAAAGYGGRLIEAEYKFAATQYNAILNEQQVRFGLPPMFSEDPRVRRPVDAVRATSLEGWQRELTKGIQMLHELMDGTSDRRAIGRTFGYLLGVDSVMGMTTEDNVEKIFGVRNSITGKYNDAGEGAGGRGHPVAALTISGYSRALLAMMAGYPINVGFVNQLTKKQVVTHGRTHTERSVPGGNKLKFIETIELELVDLGGYNYAELTGKELRIDVQKSSCGPDDRGIRTRVLWDYDDNGVQRTWYDWDWALIALLTDILHGKSSLSFKKRLNDHDIHLGVVSDTDVNCRAWSRLVGHTKPEHAVSWTELGRMMQTNPEIVTRLNRALAIEERPYLGDKDYPTLQAEIAALAGEA